MEMMKVDLENEKQKATGTRPDFKSQDGCAVWINQTKDGQKYLSIQLLGKNGIKINCFKNEPKDCK